MVLGDRLRDLRKLYGYTQGQLAYKLGITAGAVAHWESGSRSPSRDQIILLAEVFDVTSDYLIGLTTVPNGEVKTNVTVMQSKIHVYGRIPAGVPFEAIQDLLEDVEVPSWLAEKKGLFGLKVVGDSMNKVIPDGAIAVLQKTPHLENGDIGAVMVNGYDATLKKFFRLTDSVVLEPLSFNPDHEPMVIKDGTMEIQTIGKLVWFCAAQEW